VFLVAIIFYLFVDEPQRRAAFFARFGWTGSPRELIRPRSAGETPSIKGGRLSKEGRN
jgi:hypothetical protein